MEQASNNPIMKGGTLDNGHEDIVQREPLQKTEEEVEAEKHTDEKKRKRKRRNIERKRKKIKRNAKRRRRMKLKNKARKNRKRRKRKSKKGRRRNKQKKEKQSKNVQETTRKEIEESDVKEEEDTDAEMEIEDVKASYEALTVTKSEISSEQIVKEHPPLIAFGFELPLIWEDLKEKKNIEANVRSQVIQCDKSYHELFTDVYNELLLEVQRFSDVFEPGPHDSENEDSEPHDSENEGSELNKFFEHIEIYGTNKVNPYESSIEKWKEDCSCLNVEMFCEELPQNFLKE